MIFENCFETKLLVLYSRQTSAPSITIMYDQRKILTHKYPLRPIIYYSSNDHELS